MFPYFIFLGKIITLYQIMTLIGIFGVGIYATTVGKHYDIDSIDITIVLLLADAGAIIGSYILYIIINSKELFSSTSIFGTLLYLLFNGSVFFGGLLIIYFFRYKFKNINEIIYIVTPSIPLLHFFGRLGCFFTGCCFGVDSAIGFTFRNSSIKIVNNVKRFPIQLVEAFFNLMLFVVLHNFRKNGYLKNYCYGYIYYAIPS